jgi:manganese/zinc/iron transport system permease protein
MDPAVSTFFSDYTLRTVALGATVLGVTSGALGSLAVLRRQSLLGDAISHTALPGIAIAYLLTGSKLPLVLLLGAAIAGWLATFMIIGIVRSTRIKYDSALGLILSVFFGFGLVLLSLIQKTPDARQAGLDKFLFGQASTILAEDVVTMTVLGVVAIVIVLLLWKEFKLLAFDPTYADVLGFKTRGLDLTLTFVLVLAIVLGLQMVGVVLMSAMVVAPAAAARQWTDKFGAMMAISATVGAISGIGGAIASSLTDHLPTGPAIVLVAGAIVVISILFAPRRGIIWNWLTERQRNRRFQEESTLLDMYALAQQHTGRDHAHQLGVIRAMSASPAGARRTMHTLRRRGLVATDPDGGWRLTAAGFMEAERLLREQNKHDRHDSTPT